MKTQNQKDEMDILGQARRHIAADELPLAFDLLNMHLTGHRERDQLLLLENQFNNWERKNRIEPHCPGSERHRITYAFLSLLTEWELHNAPSLRNKTLLEAEKQLAACYDRIASLERPFARTDEAVCRLANTHPERFEQLEALAAELRKSKGQLDDAGQLIDFWAGELAKSEDLLPQDIGIFTELLRSSPAALLSMVNERRHRNAMVKLLEQEAARYKARYEKLKVAGIAGIAGALIGSYFANRSEQPHLGYDEQGYDTRGYDADGFDKHGFDREGHHFVDGLHRADLPDHAFDTFLPAPDADLPGSGEAHAGH